MTHQLDVLAGQKGAGLSRCVRARIVMVNNDSSSLLRFSNFSEDFRQENCGVPLRIDVLWWSSAIIDTWPVLLKKLDTIFFEVIFPQTTFVGFGSGSKTHTVDLWRSYTRLLHQSIRTFFWAIVKLCGIQWEQIFLRSCNIECICWWKKCPRMPPTHGMSHNELALRPQCSLTQRLF